MPQQDLVPVAFVATTLSDGILVQAAVEAAVIAAAAVVVLVAVVDHLL